MKLLYMSADELIHPGNLTIIATDWEVARDANFSQLIFRDHENKERLTWNSFSTNETPPLFARCRFRTSGGPTDWIKANLGNSYVKQPAINVTRETIGASDFIVLRGSAFAYYGNDILHTDTEWRVYDPDNKMILKRAVGVAETEWYIPVTVFQDPGVYTFTVRYYSTGLYSNVGKAQFTV